MNGHSPVGTSSRWSECVQQPKKLNLTQSRLPPSPLRQPPDYVGQGRKEKRVYKTQLGRYVPNALKSLGGLREPRPTEVFFAFFALFCGYYSVRTERDRPEDADEQKLAPSVLREKSLLQAAIAPNIMTPSGAMDR